MSDAIYLDYNASHPLHADAARAMTDAAKLVGNASSVHKFGRGVRAVIDEAREELARFVGARAQDVVFTSGGTEANNLALSPGLFPRESQTHARLFVSAIEHPAVLNGMRFERDQISVIPVDQNGIVDIGWLKDALDDWRAERTVQGIEETEALPLLVSVMAVNNETGIVQPIGEIAALVHEFGGLLHSDCVQALGKIDLSINELEIDLMSVSAHKIGGPQGVGALILRGADIQLRDPLIAGGGQELKRRGGTENVCGIAGFGAAIKALSSGYSNMMIEIERLRDRLENGIVEVSHDAVIFGKDVLRAPNCVCFGVPGFSAETLVIQMDMQGIAVSAGSACSSGKVEQSHVLKAMGVDDALSYGALRVSIGPGIEESDIDKFLVAWRALYVQTRENGKARENGRAA